MADAGPRVSVVVPVRNRRGMLRELLDALADQTYQDFEVIVVDDGSTDGAPDEVARDLQAGRPVRLVANLGSGAVDARRAGVAASDALYLAFTDSDCVPVAGWLEAGVAALDGGADLVNGPTWPIRPPKPLERSTASAHEGLYPTSNVFYRRSAYDAVGGFDTEAADRLGFRGWRWARGLGFGEDTLLAWSVRRKGTVAYAEAGLVHHQVLPPNLVDTLSRTLMMGAFPALVREVPELRTTRLVRDNLFLASRTRLPLYGATAALAARRRGVALLALGLWVAGHAVHLRGGPGTRAWRLLTLPVTLTLDVVKAAVLTTGSVRARSLLL
jgi:glycosyltransferase involved in cell wall biosynthesis